MSLRRLTGVTFRNYERLDFAPHDSCTILCGRNGQGKTNIIEAITVLATTRSHRGARDREMTGWSASGYRLDGMFEQEDSTLRTVVVFDGTSKRLECDGVPQERLSAAIGRTPLSVFAPEDLGLVKGGPAGRRRFLDVSLSQVSVAYLADLQVYTRALKQRNRALQDWRAQRGDRDAVRVWDASLVEAGSRLHLARTVYVRAISEEAAAVYRQISGERETLQVKYVPSIQAEEGREGGEIAAQFQDQLAQLTERERGTGITSCGPHRDDVSLHFEGRPVREYGSQGQHRSVVLALKLAEGAVMARSSLTPPITLLDDFASELDEVRQAGILERVCSRGQVIITTTELTKPLRAVQDRLVLQVTGGQLKEVCV